MSKKILSAFIDHPLLTSLFITDLLILMLHQPPFIASLLMFSLLIALCMFFGQKLALFNIN